MLPCLRVMPPNGALFTEDKAPIPVMIVAGLRKMADWQVTETQPVAVGQLRGTGP